MSETLAIPKLDPPGAGLPWIQAVFGRYLWLPYLSAVSSWQRCSQRYQQESARILSLIGPLNDERMTRRVLVDGVVGIEDSSRFWSPTMVLEHLVIVGDIIANIVVDLTLDRMPSNRIAIAELKPSGRSSPQLAIDSFNTCVARYRQRTNEEVGDRRCERRFDHPWFGKLTAHEWHCMAGLHQGLHRRQMEAILRTRNSEFKAQKVGIRR